MKKIRLILIVSFVFFAGCSSVQNSEEYKNAEAIVKNAVSGSTSENFYSDYFIQLPEKFFKNGTEIHFFAAEKIPELEYTDTLEFIIENGKVKNFNELEGIPDCFANESNCDFSIDKNKLLEILVKEKLLAKENEFIAKAVWDKKEKRFVWRATITKEKFKAGNSIRAKGIYVSVNTANGKIESVEKWEIN